MTAQIVSSVACENGAGMTRIVLDPPATRGARKPQKDRSPRGCGGFCRNEVLMFVRFNLPYGKVQEQ
jgi:hypothetical protein